ncbi:MAG TPA: GNAT family N-acetyltransferase [Chitinophagales bacterium]|nr:GNAT family N-acetyltransferase [Chitinophagales bacterium]
MLLVTNNIQLSPILKTDAEDITLCMHDKEISENTMRIPYPYTLQDANNWLDSLDEFEIENGYSRNLAIRTTEGRLIGCIGLHFNYGAHAGKSEFGYWLNKDYRNQGIMSQTIKVFSNWACEKFGFYLLEAHVFDFNIASQRALEKAGYTLTETIPNHYQKNGKNFHALRYTKQLREFCQ